MFFHLLSVLHEINILPHTLEFPFERLLLPVACFYFNVCRCTHMYVSSSFPYAHTLQFGGLAVLQLAYHGPEFRSTSNICTLRLFIHRNKASPLRSCGVALHRSYYTVMYLSVSSCHSQNQINEDPCTQQWLQFMLASQPEQGSLHIMVSGPESGFCLSQ